MKTEITSEQAIGKTVEGFLCSSMSAQMVVHFDDDTFLTFGTTRDYDGDVNIITERMDWFNFGFKEDLFKTGMLSEQEWKTMCDDVDKRRKQITEQHELEQYKRLRIKYGNK